MDRIDLAYFVSSAAAAALNPQSSASPIQFVIPCLHIAFVPPTLHTSHSFLADAGDVRRRPDPIRSGPILSNGPRRGVGVGVSLKKEAFPPTPASATHRTHIKHQCGGHRPDR